MIKDSDGKLRFYGVYRGVVADTRDPLSQSRVKLQVPQVLASQTTNWAWPVNVPSADFQVPTVGQGVWVQFEGGDVNFPIWTGQFGKEVSPDYALKFDKLLASEPISDVVDLLNIDQMSGGKQELDVTQTLLNVVRNRYYGSFLYTGTQTAVLPNTAYAVPLNTTDSTNGVSIVGGNTVRIDHNGIYNMAFSLQFAASNNSEHTVDVWLRHQGVDVPNSNSRILFKGHTILALNYFLENNTEPQDWQLMWATGSTNVVSIASLAATSVAPTTPAVILTVNKVR